ANHALANQGSLDPRPLVHADLPISAILRKAHPQLLRLLQMGQTRSLPFAQRFNLPLGHRALQLSGNSAAVESFAGSDHRGKYGDAGVVTTSVGALGGKWPATLVSWAAQRTARGRS